MQLRNNLYTVSSVDRDGETGRFVVDFNPSCLIYQAHFPDEPITPGVCIVQIGKELLEELLHRSLDIATVKNVKFLSVISPRETTSVVYQIHKVTTVEDGKKVKAQIIVATEKEVKAKISLVCRQHED